MTVTNGYCTLADLRLQLGDPGTTLPQAALERAINATSRAIDKYCGAPYRQFWQGPTVVTRSYRPDDPYEAWVHDISTATGLVVKTDTAGDGSFATTWATTDYQLEPLDVIADGEAAYRIVAIGTNTFPQSTRRPTLQVTLRPGWPAIPDGVNQAALIRAAAIFKRRESPQGVVGFSEMGAIRISRQGDPDVVELLDPYVRLDVVGV